MSQGAPARDTRERPRPTGTASIRGIVVDGVTKQPLGRVKVSVRYDDEAQATDESGAFILRGLPAGRYTINARRSGYLPTAFPDTQRSLRNRRGLTLADGEQATVTVPMFRGAAIAGRVVDEFGEPVDRAMVSVQLASSRMAGANPMANVGGDSTDDAGEFRVGRLPAGRYILSVRADDWTSAGEPQRWVPTVAASPSRTGYAVTYHPGVIALDQAGVIELERGQTMAGLEIVVASVSKTLLTGTVTNSKGELVENASLTVRPVLPGGGMVWGNHVRSMMHKGVFQAWLQPGLYDVQAQSWRRESLGTSEEHQEFARAQVTVGGDVTEVPLVLSRGVTVSGRFVFDGKSPVPPMNRPGMHFPVLHGRSDDCRTGAVNVNADGTFTVSDVFGICRANLSAGFSGWHVRSIRHAGEDITTQAIDLTKGRPLRDVEVTLSDRAPLLTFDVTDDTGSTEDYVVLLFSTRKEDWGDFQGQHVFTPDMMRVPGTSAVSNLAGRVTTTSGMILGAGDRAPGGITISSTAGSGSFGFGASGGLRGAGLSSVRPGEYFAVALDDLAPDQMRDPEFLATLSADATRITVSEGEQRISLRRRTAPR